jgi:type I restriction enzyme, R subunit
MVCPKEFTGMKSKNFEFLRPKRSMLAELAAFAEHHVHVDSAASLLNQRKFIEFIVSAIYESYRLRAPYTENLIDLMNAEPFRQSVPEVVQGKLHLVRKAGNQAAHSRVPTTTDLALDCLYQMFDVARWFYLQVDGGKRADTPTYEPPIAETPSTASGQKTKQALEQAALANEKFNSLLKEFEEERQKRLVAEEAARDGESAKQELAKLQARRTEGKKVSDALAFNEKTTRALLIDQMLREAGWDVSTQGRSTDAVGQEVRVTTMPTPSGEGFVDYVLYGDDGKPLAVVEAKKTAKSAQEGAEQARMYATCMEKETGVRPVVFFTNGNDIFLWDDVQGYAYRKIYGFYSQDSLEYLVHQRTAKRPLEHVAPDQNIAGRMYQLEAIKRVTERFSSKYRKALLVQATGTGKTRVAISICETLMRAGWAKRILFLCDRKELRKQADRAFKQFMPNEPRVVVTSSTSSDRDKRIYLATYPAMMQCYEAFDVGFFDLIIADESHRSIYKKFRSLFQYFDALEVGLTATPVQFIERNTYGIFGCTEHIPTSNYGFDEAINATPAYLVPFRVRVYGSQFREDGIRYAQLSEAQREQLDHQDPIAEEVDYSPQDIDKKVFNRDMTRSVWRALMDEGIRDATSTQIGKTIVFARSHLHAMHMAEVFSEMYPQYGSTFCRVIDTQEPKADQLIEDFKDAENGLTIAVSIDMLDTGIDVPEVVNLVFAKPVKSYVKFWQMIGRGTRLRENLFGPGRHKTEFLIFDHWSNFWYFDEKYKETQPAPQKSLLQHLFEARVELAQVSQSKLDQAAFGAATQLLLSDVRAVIDTKAIDARDNWHALEALTDGARLEHFAPATRADLLRVAAPLQHLRTIEGDANAYRFDLLMAKLQVELVKGGAASSRVADFRARVEAEVDRLAMNQNPVKACAEAITQVRSDTFWKTAEVHQLEGLRQELRGIMKYQQDAPSSAFAPHEIDVTDAARSAADYAPKLGAATMVEYRNRVNAVLSEHFANNPTLQRIKEGRTVTDRDLEELAQLLLQVDNRANVKHLVGQDPETRRSLLMVFRSLVGLDPTAVQAAFANFLQKYPLVSAQQVQFLTLLQNYIAQNGGIEIERLYDAPFTTVHAESLEGVFTREEEANELFSILETFRQKTPTPTDPPPASKRAS